MNSFTPVFAVLGLLASGALAANCPGECIDSFYKKPCKAKSDLPSGYAGLFNGAPGPCFEYSGKPVSMLTVFTFFLFPMLLLFIR